MALIHIVFFILIVLAIIEFFVDNKIIKPLFFFVLLLLVGLAAFRPLGFDRDSIMYLDFISMIGTPTEYFFDNYFFLTYEPLYYLIPSITQYFFSSDMVIRTFLILFAILGVTYKLRAIISLTEFWFLSFLIYFSNFFLLQEMTQIRGGVACGIFLFALQYFNSNQRWKFVILIFFAFFFHYGSVLLLLVLLLDRIKFSKVIFLSILAVTFYLGFVNSSVLDFFATMNLGPFSQKVEIYQELTEGQVDGFGDINKFNLVFLVQFISAVIFIFFHEKIVLYNTHASLLIKCMVAGLFFFQFFNALPAIAFRTSEMFLTVNIINYTFYLYLFKHRLIGLCIVIGLSCAQFFLNVYYAKIFEFIEYL